MKCARAAKGCMNDAEPDSNYCAGHRSEFVLHQPTLERRASLFDRALGVAFENPGRSLFAMLVLAFASGIFAHAGIDAAAELELARAEREAVYGIDLSPAPWSPSACSKIAGLVEIGNVARRAGARKSLFMAQIEPNPKEEEQNAGEATRDISLAWDAGLSGRDYFLACLAKFVRAQKETAS